MTLIKGGRSKQHASGLSKAPARAHADWRIQCWNSWTIAPAIRNEPVWKIAQHVRGKSYRENLAYPATGVMAGEAHHDSQTLVRPVSTVFAQKGPKDIEAAKSRHVQDTRSGGAARASRAVLQTSRLGGPTRAARRLPNIQARFDLVAGRRPAPRKTPPPPP